MNDQLTSVPDDDLDDGLDEGDVDGVPGRHTTGLAGAGKGSWLAELGMTPADLAGKIIAVAAYKGGIGKTMLSYELAYLLGGTLVDLDWDKGNASRAWGYREESRTTRPLLDALERGRLDRSGPVPRWEGKAPRPLAGGPWRPDLVPCSTDFVDNQPTPELGAAAIEAWAAQWGEEMRCPVIIDTHPGGGPATYSAVAAAHVIVVPVVLGEREMEATEGLLDELKSYRLLLIPNKVSTSPPARYINWLERISSKAFVPVGPAISLYPRLTTRQRRMAVCASDPTPAWARGFVDEMHQVARAVVNGHVTT